MVEQEALKTSPKFVHLPPLLPEPKSSIAGHCRLIATPRSGIVSSHTLEHAGATLPHWGFVSIYIPWLSGSSLRPFGDVRPFFLVSCCRLNLRAETSATDRRYCALYDARPKARSTSYGHVILRPARHLVSTQPGKYVKTAVDQGDPRHFAFIC